MLPIRSLSGLAAVTAAATLALTTGAAGAHTLPHGTLAPAGGSAGAVFVQTDDPAGNAIVVYDRATDGALTQAGTYATGGDGGQTEGSVADHLSSQGSLVYDARFHELFAVNAGSDTVTAFAVDGDQLTRTQVIGSGGDFPVSVAVHGRLVYVLDALDGGAIQGYRLSGDGWLTPIAGSTRALGLDPTAAPQFVNTPGQIAFTPGGGDLLVTTKANGDDVDVFPVAGGGRPAASPVVNQEPGEVPFAVAFGRGGQIAIAEAGTGSVGMFTLGADGTLTAAATVATGQMATCWLIADGSLLFAGNAGSATESTIAALPLGTPALIDTTSTDAGTIDAATSPGGGRLYVQTGVAGTVDEYRVSRGGELASIGSVTVPDGVGQEGIATS